MKRSNSKGATTEWVLLGCGCFFGLIVIIVLIFVVIYRKANFLASPRYFPSSMEGSGKLNEDCDKLLGVSKDYIGYINDAAEKYNVDPALIAAIAEQESTWNPKAYRYEPSINDSSYGLMQTLYGTAKGLGYSGTPEGLYDPQTSIEYGTKYISQQLEQYKDPALALAAYNGGPGAIANGQIQWSKEYSDEVMARYKKYQDCLEQASSSGTVNVPENASDNMKKLLEKAQGWPGQDGDPTGCFRADKKLIADTFPGATQHDMDTNIIGRTLPPSDQDLQSLSNHLSNGDIPVWHINGESSGEHWIIITGIDEEKNITFLDPNGGVLRTLPYNQMSNVNNGGNVAFFGRTGGAGFAPDDWLRGVYFTP